MGTCEVMLKLASCHVADVVIRIEAPGAVAPPIATKRDMTVVTQKLSENANWSNQGLGSTTPGQVPKQASTRLPGALGLSVTPSKKFSLGTLSGGGVTPNGQTPRALGGVGKMAAPLGLGSASTKSGQLATSESALGALCCVRWVGAAWYSQRRCLRASW